MRKSPSIFPDAETIINEQIPQGIDLINKHQGISQLPHTAEPEASSSDDPAQQLCIDMNVQTNCAGDDIDLDARNK